MENYKKVEMFRCDFCGKILKNETCMKKHIEVCKKNPKFYEPKCFRCEFFEVIEEEKKCWYCKKQDQFLASIRGKILYKEFENCKTMPQNCDDFVLDKEK